MSDIVIRVENVSKLYRLGEVGTGSLDSSLSTPPSSVLISEIRGKKSSPALASALCTRHSLLVTAPQAPARAHEKALNFSSSNTNLKL